MHDDDLDHTFHCGCELRYDATTGIALLYPCDPDTGCPVVETFLEELNE